MKLVVNSENIGERIDSFLSKNEELDLTRSKIQELIKTGNILVNDISSCPSFKCR